MKRKYTYPLLVLLFTAGYLLFEDYINEQLDKPSKNTNIETVTTDKPSSLSNLLPSSTTGQIVAHSYYTLSYNEKHEQPEWVAYQLDKKHLSRNEYKRPYFDIDAKVSSKAAHWRNYKSSGYDKGHLCPAGDRRFSKKAYNETFLTSNISPQKHDFNAGVWNRLEQKVRYWAKKYNGVYVITGGVLKNKNKTIGTEKVTVPEAFYKIVYDDDADKMIAFLIPHKDSNKPLYEFVTSVDRIESLTGIDFFPNLNNPKEKSLEANTSYKAWSFR